jgi:hypothetical protein
MASEEINPEEQKSEGNNVEPFSLNERLMSCYLRLSSGDEEDNAGLLTLFMSSIHEYSYASTISNSVNDRQGKNRKVYYDDSHELMNAPYDEEVDPNIDRDLQEAQKATVESYISDKASDQKNYNKIKALMIMLILNGQLTLISDLYQDKLLPDEISNELQKAIQSIYKSRTEVTDEFIKYLDTTGNRDMAEKARSLGEDLWGGEKRKTIDIWNKDFHQYESSLKDSEAIYERFKAYRKVYMNYSRNIKLQDFYDTFEITPDSYKWAKGVLIQELAELQKSDEGVKAFIDLLMS